MCLCESTRAGISAAGSIDLGEFFVSSGAVCCVVLSWTAKVHRELVESITACLAVGKLLDFKQGMFEPVAGFTI